MLECEFSYFLGVGLLSFLLLIPFGFTQGGFVGVGNVLMTGLNHGKRLGALSGPLFFILRAGTISHRFISFFSEKILTSCCKATHFLSPISFIGVTCAIFEKFPISVTAFVMESVIEVKGIFFNSGKIQPCLLIAVP